MWKPNKTSLSQAVNLKLVVKKKRFCQYFSVTPQLKGVIPSDYEYF